MKRLACALMFVVASAGATSHMQNAPAPALSKTPISAIPLPNRDGSLKFAVFGDFGTAEKSQYQMATQMAEVRKRFPFELVILVGDNLYGTENPDDFRRKFEVPYKPLIDAGVKFYAALGNHDVRNQRFYKPFNMDGKLYYSLKAPKQSVRFFALESTYPTQEQFAWVTKELKDSGDEWKIPFFHHPLYSSGGRHGSDTELRSKLEPLFLEHNVSVVFTGHDHFYERTKPQKDITYFVVGSGGKLRTGDIDQRSPLVARGFDTDLAFLVAEINGDELTFNAIARSGQVVDSGVLNRRRPQK